MDQSLSYRHSGRFSALGPVASVALGGLAGVPLAVAYGYILVYVPIVGKFTFVLAMVLGGLVGFVAGQVLKKTNTRNHTVATVAGVAAAAIAWYFSWVAWTCALLGEGWAVEASIILALGGFAGWAFPSAPFCESCSAWTEQRTDVARISVSA